MKHETCIETNSASQTDKVARLLGKEIKNILSPHAIIVALSGELGSGKTTFVKGLAKGLGIEASITSPTFILISKYLPTKKLQAKSYKLKAFYHIDPYRLKDAKDILPELQEFFTQENAVIAIEWGERLKEFLPKDTIWVELKHMGENRRSVVIKSD